MADCSSAVSQQFAEVNGINAKVVCERNSMGMAQGSEDNQADSREVRARSRAWEDLALRKAQNAASFDHFVNMNAAQATAAAEQTGQTENDQTVSPIRTGTGDAIAAVPGVAAGMVSMSGADIAQIVAQTVAAVVPIVINASGGASTPSQTSTKTS